MISTGNLWIHWRFFCSSNFFWILKNGGTVGTKDLNTFHGRKTFTLKAKPGCHESELRFSISPGVLDVHNGILLMVQKSQGQPVGMVLKPCK